MSANKRQTKQKTSTNPRATAPTGANAKDLEVEADVLFQKIYQKWYAFTVLEDDCLVSEVPNEDLVKKIKKTPRAA